MTSSRHRWLQGLLLALAGCFPILAILGFWYLLPPLIMAFIAAGIVLAVLRGGQGRRVRRRSTAADGSGGDGGYGSGDCGNGSHCGSDGGDGGGDGGGSSD